LSRLGHPDPTAHGFNLPFSDWCAERNNFSAQVREITLAHKVSNEIEAAYRRQTAPVDDGMGALLRHSIGRCRLNPPRCSAEW
jgi:hypothetical protein